MLTLITISTSAPDIYSTDQLVSQTLINDDSIHGGKDPMIADSADSKVSQIRRNVLRYNSFKSDCDYIVIVSILVL